jgi:hypothetical protein
MQKQVVTHNTVTLQASHYMYKSTCTIAGVWCPLLAVKPHLLACPSVQWLRTTVYLCPESMHITSQACKVLYACAKAYRSRRIERGFSLAEI